MTYATIDEEIKKASYLGISKHVDDELAEADCNSSSVAPWSGRISEELDALGRTRADWDGFGASEPNDQSLKTAHGLLSYIAQTKSEISEPFLELGSNGCIALLWERSKKTLDVEITSASQIAYLFRDRDAKRPDIAGSLQYRTITPQFMELLDQFC